jgi:hypothetical protein
MVDQRCSMTLTSFSKLKAKAADAVGGLKQTELNRAG